MTASGSSYLFVYGTLRKGAQSRVRHELWLNSKFVGRGWMAGRLFDLGKYPGAVREARSRQHVDGEIYRIRQVDVLDRLDKYEGLVGRVPEGQFRRTIAPVYLNSGRRLRAWVYTYARSRVDKPEVLSGRYKRKQSSTAEVQKIAARVLDEVKSGTGKRLEEIARALRVDPAAIKQPVSKMLAAKKLRTTGTKRGTKYFTR